MLRKDFEPTSDSWSKTIFDSSTYAGDTTGGTAGCTYTYFQDNTDNLLGKILTIVDASYADPAQREAVKSLVKDAFYKFRSPSNWTITTGSVGDSIEVVPLPYVTA